MPVLQPLEGLVEGVCGVGGAAAVTRHDAGQRRRRAQESTPDRERGAVHGELPPPAPGRERKE